MPRQLEYLNNVSKISIEVKDVMQHSNSQLLNLYGQGVDGGDASGEDETINFSTYAQDDGGGGDDSIGSKLRRSI
ncbi:hypothetical protein [Nostoc sp.]|uniref:hypothetical protein n=1 Tax=Nostoc sp. TaxID=1180 RepID=UPI002FF66C48